MKMTKESSDRPHVRFIGKGCNEAVGGLTLELHSWMLHWGSSSECISAISGGIERWRVWRNVRRTESPKSMSGTSQPKSKANILDADLEKFNWDLIDRD